MTSLALGSGSESGPESEQESESESGLDFEVEVVLKIATRLEKPPPLRRIAQPIGMGGGTA